MSGLRLALPLFVAVVFSACPEPHNLPGDELIGTYSFVARRLDGGCEGLSETQPAAAGTLEFLGTLTRCLPESPVGECLGTPGRAFFTVGLQDFDAGFDGQYVHVFPHSAERSFVECGSEPTRMEETLDFALLSASQRAAAGSTFVCGPNALDGGVPPPDGGVVLPGPSANGFDAVLACGTISYTVVNDAYLPEGGAGVCRRPDGGTALPQGRCTFAYSLSGERR